MTRIHKYKLTLDGTQYVEIHDGFKHLSVQLRGDEICLWAMIDDESPTSECTFRIFGTGHPIEDPSVLRYIDTAQAWNGFIWHVFYEARQ